MIRFIILLFFISTTSLLSVSGNTIKCEYSETTSHGYGCVVTSLEDSFVKNTAGRHLRGYSNKDVEYFEATSKNLQFLPKNIDKIFPKLKAIKLNFNSLTELSHEDLKPFGEKLTFLSIVNSAIDVIPSDLFKSTPYISYMYLESPYLKSIENGAFDRLFYLNGFFARFGCFSDDAIDRDDVEKLIRSLSIRCHKKEVRFQNKPRPVAQAPPKAQVAKLIQFDDETAHDPISDAFFIAQENNSTNNEKSSGNFRCVGSIIFAISCALASWKFF